MLNTDASVIQPNRLGFAEGAFRDSSCNWKLGYNQTIDITSPLHSKLCSILVGLHVALNFGFEKLIIQTDSTQVVTLHSSPQMTINALPLAHAIMAMPDRFLATKVIWIPHECNTIADSTIVVGNVLIPAVGLVNGNEEEFPPLYSPVKKPRVASLGVATLLQEMKARKVEKVKAKVPEAVGQGRVSFSQ
ncbi:hypothetical protein V6N11_039104 [Hibiscus sabdariffa]|uniref:RNase H type-1 domain-containing protein n=1 Tax=Hibiscus sabdariffa TaxID=183260 RepID=A0ABR2SLX3_9ROSI